MPWSFTTTPQTGPKEIVGVVLFNQTGFILFLPQWSKSTYNPHLTHAVTANVRCRPKPKCVPASSYQSDSTCPLADGI